MAGTNGNGNGNGAPKVGTDTVKQGLAQMLKGGVIVSWPGCLWWFFVDGFKRQELRMSTIWREGSDIMRYMSLRHIFSCLKIAERDAESELLEERSVQPRRFLLFSASCVRLVGPVSLAGFTESWAISDGND